MNENDQNNILDYIHCTHPAIVREKTPSLRQATRYLTILQDRFFREEKPIYTIKHDSEDESETQNNGILLHLPHLHQSYNTNTTSP
jgi:hypothetical protein